MNILVIVICLLISTFTYSADRMHIFFINGVNATADEANFNMAKLEDLMPYDSKTITWDVLYNATHGLIKSDLIDYLRQKRQETRNLSIDDYTNGYINKNKIACCSNPKDYLDVKESLKIRYLEDKNYVGINLKDIVGQFHKKVGDINGLYVLIIAHSQGNEYANQLWDYLVNGESFPKERIAIFSIASPTNSVRGLVNPNLKFNYVTADNDRVIRAARFLPGIKPMPANIHLKGCKDIACHNLVNAYLFDKESSSTICKSIGSYISLWLNQQPVC